jgi:hypothetical protein
MTVSGQDRHKQWRAARLLGRDDQSSRQVLGCLWYAAFNEGSWSPLFDRRW